MCEPRKQLTMYMHAISTYERKVLHSSPFANNSCLLRVSIVSCKSSASFTNFPTTLSTWPAFSSLLYLCHRSLCNPHRWRLILPHSLVINHLFPCAISTDSRNSLRILRNLFRSDPRNIRCSTMLTPVLLWGAPDFAGFPSTGWLIDA